MLKLTGVLCLVVLLTACGGGGSGPTVQMPAQTPPAAARLAFPLSGNVATTGIGQDSIDRLPAVARRGNTGIRFGTLSDGASHATVAAYLSSASEGTVHRFHSAPEVRVIGRSTARERAMVEGAVEAINLALPPEYRMRIGEPRSAFSLSHTTDAEGYIFYSSEMLPGTIYVEFLPCADYHGCGRSAATSWSIGGSATEDRRAYIEFARGTVSHGDDRQGPILMAHELMHAIGVDEHVSQWLDSIVRGSDHYSPATPQILTRLDREAMQALYGRLEPGDDPADFGPWLRSSLHIAGNGRAANFGVALRNGYAEAWAHGVRPSTTLAGNRALTGSATWTGALVGLTPAAEAVTGDAAIGVDLGTMRGDATFTGLESWAARAAPGAAGTGTQWLDGELAYTISVNGNTFRQTSGDAGTLTGIFTGQSHEGAAGTLERSDLMATFGASRQ